MDHHLSFRIIVLIQIIGLLFTHKCLCCNIRELTNIIEDHFKKEMLPKCGIEGEKTHSLHRQKHMRCLHLNRPSCASDDADCVSVKRALGDKTCCTYDRDCCKGLECKMGVTGDGVDSFCEEGVITKDSEVDIDRMWEDDNRRNSWPNRYRRPIRDDDGENDDEDEKESYKHESNYSDYKEYDEDISNNTIDKVRKEMKKLKNDKLTLSKLESLEEKKKRRLIEENRELEKLFNEKYESEIKELKALKEDAEMDELRRLRELKVKRKLAMLKELEELRQLSAKEDLNSLTKYGKSSSRSNAAKGESEIDTLIKNITNKEDEEKVKKSSQHNKQPSPLTGVDETDKGGNYENKSEDDRVEYDEATQGGEQKEEYDQQPGEENQVPPTEGIQDEYEATGPLNSTVDQQQDIEQPDEQNQQRQEQQQQQTEQDQQRQQQEQEPKNGITESQQVETESVTNTTSAT